MSGNRQRPTDSNCAWTRRTTGRGSGGKAVGAQDWSLVDAQFRRWVEHSLPRVADLRDALNRIVHAKGSRSGLCDYRTTHTTLRVATYLRTRADRPEDALVDEFWTPTGLHVTSSTTWKSASIFVSPCFIRICSGGPGRVRTDDLFHAMEARSQLRHRPLIRNLQKLV
jgi:hypothetical protein